VASTACGIIQTHNYGTLYAANYFTIIHDITMLERLNDQYRSVAVVVVQAWELGRAACESFSGSV
jgi:hypothetical protein